MKTALKITVGPLLDDIKHRRLTIRDAAKQLGVSEAHLSRTVKDLGMSPEPSPKHRQKELTKARKDYRELVARTMPLQQAAKAANCSQRTIKRILEK